MTLPDSGTPLPGLPPVALLALPWRIEDEVKKLGANFVQAGMWRGFAIRDGNLITGQQQNSGAAAAELMVKALNI